jgi:hypothetical protein
LDDGLLLVTDGGALVALDAQGKALWEALEAGCAEDELVGACVEAGIMDAGAARARVHDTLAAWRRAGVLDGAGAPVRRASPERPAINGHEFPASAFEAVYQVGERPVRLRCGDRDLGVLIDAALRPFRVETPTPAGPLGKIDIVREAGRRFTVRCGDAVLARVGEPTENPASARHRCLTALVEAARPARRWLAILHASAIARGDRCVLFLGGSGSGKSTLAAGLVARGHRFVTDDYAPVEQGSWLVWPVPVAPSIKSGSWRAVAAHFPALLDQPVFRHRGLQLRYLELDPGARAPLDTGLPIAALVFPRYVPGVGLTARRLTAREALAAICEARSLLDRRPELLRETLQLVGKVPAYRIDQGDLDLVGAWVDALPSGGA